MPFLLCNILLAFPLFLHIFSLVFCTSSCFLCVKILLMLTFMQVVRAGFFLCFHQWGLLYKAMACFHQNDGLFSSKRRVTFLKRRVVFFKSTACFSQTTGRFWGQWMRRKEKEERWKAKCKNTYNNSLSRAHAYAHTTGVFLFLLSQVSRCYR